jgi:hypothetical protein
MKTNLALLGICLGIVLCFGGAINIVQYQLKSLLALSIPLTGVILFVVSCVVHSLASNPRHPLEKKRKLQCNTHII